MEITQEKSRIEIDCLTIMPEIDALQYLKQVLHATENFRNPEDKDRDATIDRIQKRIHTYIEGVTRNHNKQMINAVMAGLEELKPEIEALALTAFGNEDTSPDLTVIPASEKRLK